MIYNAIIQKLSETQDNYSVKIPLAIESGSRGWGFASPDSDYDCRFIYVNKKDWYISVFDKQDFIEYAADEVFDINGWDLKKVIVHILKSNAVIFEWLSSNEIYMKNEAVVKILLDLCNQFFNPIAVSHHYLSLAVNKYKEITIDEKIKLKKYFYILRPLANIKYIETYGKMPHMECYKTLSEIDIDNDILNEINRLSEQKKLVNESFVIPQSKLLLDYFDNEIKRQDSRLKEMKFNKNKDYNPADVAFRKIIEMMWENE